MIVFALIALGWWLAAPDRFTAAARTASGTGLKAAGAGAKVHWNAGRPSRQARRTGRRDRWWKAGGWRRNALRAEHAAVWTWGAGKTAGGIAAAAARPVPAAIRNGWQAGQDRHGARAAGKPAGLALDPPTPWWRKPDPEPVPDEAGQDSGTGAEDSLRTVPAVTTVPGNNRYEPDPYKTVLTRQPNGNVRAEVFYTGAPEHGEQSIWDDEFLSAEGAQRGAEGLIQEVQADHGRKAPATVSWVDRTVTAVPPQPLYGALTDLPTGTGPGPVQADGSAGTGRGPNPEPARGPVGTGIETDPVQTWTRVPHEVLDEDVPTDPPAETPFFPDAPDGPVLDSEADIRDRNPELARINPDPLTEGQRRFWHLRDRGYPGALDQDGWPAPDFHTGAVVNLMPYLDQPTGTDPDGSITPTTPTDRNGAPMPTPTELRTHVAVQDFAQQVDSMSQASDFIVVAEKARTVGEQSRAGGFGAEMDSAVDSLEETARQFASSVDALREQAHKYAQTSLSVQGS